MTTERVYLIESRKSDKIDNPMIGKRGDAVFWRPNRAGYTTSIGEAGLYTAAEAMELCRLDGDVLSPWHINDVLKAATIKRKTIDDKVTLPYSLTKGAIHP